MSNLNESVQSVHQKFYWKLPPASESNQDGIDVWKDGT